MAASRSACPATTRRSRISYCVLIQFRTKYEIFSRIPCARHGGMRLAGFRFSRKEVRMITGKKVAILVAEGFEQVEMTKPREALDHAGARLQSSRRRRMR